MPGTPLERAPVPDLGHAPIPKERYTSREFAAREWERMWTRVWLLAARESDLPEPGDYAVYEIGTESILVVRQPDRSIVTRDQVRPRGALAGQGADRDRVERVGRHVHLVAPCERRRS